MKIFVKFRFVVVLLYTIAASATMSALIGEHILRRADIRFLSYAFLVLIVVACSCWPRCNANRRIAISAIIGFFVGIFGGVTGILLSHLIVSPQSIIKSIERGQIIGDIAFSVFISFVIGNWLIGTASFTLYKFLSDIKFRHGREHEK